MMVASSVQLTARKEGCRCQNRRISGRGSRTVHLRRMVTEGREHDEGDASWDSLQERKTREKSEMMVASSVQLTAAKVGFYDLMAQWALLRCFDRGSLPCSWALYYRVV